MRHWQTSSLATMLCIGNLLICRVAHGEQTASFGLVLELANIPSIEICWQPTGEKLSLSQSVRRLTATVIGHRACSWQNLSLERHQVTAGTSVLNQCL